MDPRQEGRCFCCLARGHVARSCREPVKCRVCRQGGHRQASCPYKTTPPSAPASTGLYACLVGELRDTDPQWQQIIDRIQMLCPDLTSPDCHRLPAGDVFIRGLSKEAWQLIHGQTQQLNGGGHILWRQPLPTDGAFPTPTTTRRMEARGVPFSLCNWCQLERLVRPVGSLRKIVSNGLHSGDPNCICIDVEMATDMDVPRKVTAAAGGAAGPEIHLAVLPAPPPPPPHSPPAYTWPPARIPPLGQQRVSWPKNRRRPNQTASPTIFHFRALRPGDHLQWYPLIRPKGRGRLH